MSNGGEPIDKFTNFVTLPTDPALALAVLSNAWADYYKKYHTYPTVWVAVGSTVFYGGY